MQDEAHAFINYLCRKSVAEKNAEYIGYFSPIDSISRALVQDGTLPDLLPTAAQMEKMECFHDLGENRRKFDEMWTAVKG